MLYDRIENLPVWAERIPALREALLAAHTQITAPFAEGTVEYNGRQCYAVSSVYLSASRSEKRFENHRLYLDVQMPAEGTEQIDVFIPATPYSADYCAERDIEFLAYDGDTTTVTLQPGEFLVLFPGEWHRPGIMAGTMPGQIKKHVLKAEFARRGDDC